MSNLTNITNITNIHLKFLSGDVQTLTFPTKNVTLNMVKLAIPPVKNHKIILLKEDDEKDEKEENILLNNEDVLNVFYDKEEFTSEENKTYETMLRARVPFFDEFKAEIIKSEAVIAGGSVLAVFANYQINDLDIYIHYSKTFEFVKFLLKQHTIFSGFHAAPAYDESFFRKNKIMGRFRFVIRDRYLSTGIDVMVIPDEVPIENVVTNFDLSFCQVWWNGQKMLSDDITDVRTKSGRLNNDYISSFFNMNTFTINRIKKYKDRGFKISIDIDAYNHNDTSKKLVIEKKNKDISECPEEWIVSKICYFILQKFNTWTSSILFFDIYPEEMKLHKVEEKLGTELLSSVARLFYYESCMHFEKKYKDLYENTFHNILSEERDDARDEEILSRFVDVLTIKLEEIRRETRQNRRAGNVRNQEEHVIQVDRVDINGNLVINGDVMIHGNLVIGQQEQ